MSEDDADDDDHGEVDDDTFEMYCPVTEFTSMDASEFDTTAATTTTSTDDVLGSNVLPSMTIEKDGCEMLGGVLPVNPPNPKRQYTIEEAFQRKNTIEASRRTRAKSKEKYMFVHSTLHCMQCSAYGETRIVVGDDNYFRACLGVKWFDTEFIATFVSLIAHDSHVEMPPFAYHPNRVLMITCPFPEGIVYPANVLSYDNSYAHFLLIAYNANHFAVLDFNIHLRAVSVYDGFNNKIDGWKHHVVHTLRQYGLVPLDIVPKIRYSQQVIDGSGKKQRLDIQFGIEAPWIVENSVYLRQKDGHNCGPIACTKVMEVFGYIEEGGMEAVGSRVGGYRRVVMDKFADLISKYDHQLRVQMRETVDENGATVQNMDVDGSAAPPHEPNCFCNDNGRNDDVHTLECCGKKVHVNCLAAYIHTIPFCMFCSTSFFQSYKSLPEQAVALPMMSQSAPSEESGVNDVDVMNDDDPPEQITLCQVIPNGSVGGVGGNGGDGEGADGGEGGNGGNGGDGEGGDGGDGEGGDGGEGVEGGDGGEGGEGGEDGEDGDGNNDGDSEGGDDGGDANMTMEDVVRKDAREKKSRMQALSAEKEMKRRGDCLVAAGLGTGAVLTLKVDYRTHSHAEGLVVIVYKSNETGAALVCCESGVVTHDGSKKDYWVPSDKFVVSAGAGELAAIPKSLQNIRDDVVNGTYDYGAQPRISYSKLHAQVIGASSPCKRAMCSCKGGVCGKRCGCHKKNIMCNSACACSGNCGWKEEAAEAKED